MTELRTVCKALRISLSRSVRGPSRHATWNSDDTGDLQPIEALTKTRIWVNVMEQTRLRTPSDKYQFFCRPCQVSARIMRQMNIPKSYPRAHYSFANTCDSCLSFLIRKKFHQTLCCAKKSENTFLQIRHIKRSWIFVFARNVLSSTSFFKFSNNNCANHLLPTNLSNEFVLSVETPPKMQETTECRIAICACALPAKIFADNVEFHVHPRRLPLQINLESNPCFTCRVSRLLNDSPFKRNTSDQRSRLKYTSSPFCEIFSTTATNTFLKESSPDVCPSWKTLRELSNDTVQKVSLTNTSESGLRVSRRGK